MNEPLNSRFCTTFTAALITSVFAALSVSAADVKSYGVARIASFAQNSTGAPTADPAAPYTGFFGVNPDDFSAINTITVTTPSGATFPLPEVTDYQLSQNFGDQAQLNNAFGPGVYTFNFDTSNDGTKAVKLNLLATAFGSAPQLSNFTALQTASADGFTIQWSPFNGGTADDLIELFVLDSSGNEIFNSGGLWDFGALNGTATSYNVESGFLDPGQTYDAILRFAKVIVKDTTSYLGASGLISVGQQTKFKIKTSGTSSNPAGGSSPTILITSPLDGATAVPSVTPILIAFSSPMKPVASITWSGNGVDSSKFSYTWPDPTVLSISYSGGLPGGTLITMTLTSGFTDLTGIPIAPKTISFTTAGTPGGGTTNPPDNCNPGGPGGLGGTVLISKNLKFLQTGTPAPSLSPQNGAGFTAIISSPTKNPVIAVNITLPNGIQKPVESQFGQFLYLVPFATQAALDSQFPSGNYVVKLTRQDGVAQNITLQLGDAPPTPQLSNFSEVNNYNSTIDTTFRWAGFVGAGVNDGIQFSLEDVQNKRFDAPDPCVPRELANTATSIVVPKNLLSASGEITGDLNFSRFASNNSVTDIRGFASYSKIVSFKLRTSVTPPPSANVKLLAPVLQANGTFKVGITGGASASYLPETSPDLKSWTPQPPVTLNAAGTGEFTVPGITQNLSIRARSTQ
ncbi:MAG: hypothetical protein EXS31_05030 [Pedosphaera sp.]|nr:hypothetical protein [Pedosphaera sp.]